MVRRKWEPWLNSLHGLDNCSMVITRGSVNTGLYTESVGAQMFEDDRDAIIDRANAAQNSAPAILVGASERNVASTVLSFTQHQRVEKADMG